MRVFLLSAFGLLALGAAGAADCRRSTITLTRSVANVEFLRATLFPAPPQGAPRLPAIEGAAWHGEIVRRLPEDVAGFGTAHFVPFVAEYVEGVASRAWCDTNLDGDLADAPPLPLSRYPPIPGARSFLADLRWPVGSGDRTILVERTIRVVLEPSAGPGSSDPPRYRLQSVFAMTGTAEFEGRPHRVFLFDGDGDGLYTRGLADGLFADLDDDGRVVVDQMGPEFGSFSVPFTLGATAYEVTALDPEGRQVTLCALGPGAARPPAPSIGAPAPDFSFTSSDGRPVRLSALRGRPVLVYFWSSSCRTCARQAAGLRRLYDRFQAAGLEIVGISYDADRAAMEAFRAAHGQTWPTSFSGRQLWEDPIGRLYRERGTGMLYLVDRSGALVLITSDLGPIESALADRTP